MSKATIVLKIFSLSLGATALLSLPAFADQCSYITKEQAILAVSRLQVGQTLYYLCEPCGEKLPQQVLVQSLAAGTVGYENFWQVQVNNAGIDLAYVYIESGIGNPPINLAAVAGCPATGVSLVLPARRY
ncbi:hypothetical protein [Gloeothece verrucosa]|uniref:Uncharacterized protein n=1 Tax=Gloeothece verrucosa (strain PCC 7822) TaxID=497965 RepID=E0UKF5_GLOV7|nr:hypothetical protein [Gloeothece verrucosa]ADN17036.1 conserved hypothetical protein [Gloeothece verrucosa PCC 7822]